MTGQELSAPDRRARCEELAERISHYHDDRWPKVSGECSEVEAHLAECPRCAELLDDYRAISGAARLIRSVDTPAADGDEMSRRVRARLRSRVFMRRLKWTGAGVGFAAAAAAAVVALTVLPGSAPPAGGDLAREEAPSAVGEPASGQPGPAGPEAAGTKAVVAPAEGRGHGADRADRRELVRRIEVPRRPRARRPADGVRLVGEGTGPRHTPVAPRIVPQPKPPLLGVFLKDVARQPGEPVVGIVGVDAGSAAERAGLRVGDIILSIDGKSVRGAGPDHVSALIRRAGPGARITIEYARDGRPRKADVTLAGKR